MLQPRRSKRLLYYRCMLAMAWVAMCLLFAGPIISQFQASHHQHDSPADTAHAEHHHHHDAGTVEHHPPSPAQPSERSLAKAAGLADTDGLTHWHIQCGYCELWQHSPSLSIALPAIAHGASINLGGVTPAPQGGALFQYNYPNALTRGPPSLIQLPIKSCVNCFYSNA